MGNYVSPWRTEELDLFRATVRTFLKREATPHLRRWAEQHVVDRELWTKAGAAGLRCCSIPEAYGGGGGSFAADLVVLEEQARICDTGWGNHVHSGIVAHYLLAYGTEEQKRRWLPRMATGELIGAIAMTEPDTGSDLKAVTTRAVRDGDEYVISGAKTFITNGSSANLVIVVAKTDPAAGARGMSLIVVERTAAPGSGADGCWTRSGSPPPTPANSSLTRPTCRWRTCWARRAAGLTSS